MLGAQGQGEAGTGWISGPFPPSSVATLTEDIMGTLDSAQKRLEEARKHARSRATTERVGPDWPRADGIELGEALEEVSIAMLEDGARLSFGVTDGSADVWGRLAYPLDCKSAHAGMVAFMTAGTVENALRKLAQTIPSDLATKVYWKPDRFAR
jgi:hypothetical protein